MHVLQPARLSFLLSLLQFQINQICYLNLLTEWLQRRQILMLGLREYYFENRGFILIVLIKYYRFGLLITLPII